MAEILPPASFLDMPKEVLIMILEHTDLQTLSSIQRSSKKLHTFLKDAPIEINQHQISIQIDTNKIELFFSSEEKSTTVIYEQQEYGCLVTVETFWRRSVFFNGGNMLRIAYRNLKAILRHQKSQLMCLTLAFRHTDSDFYRRNCLKFQKHLRNHLASRIQPLQVNELVCEINFQFEIMIVLPFLDRRFIEEITILPERNNPRGGFDISELFQTEQWRNLKTLRIPVECIAPVSMEHFVHLRKTSIKMDAVNFQMLNEFKEAFLRHPSPLSDFCLQYNEFDDFDAVSMWKFGQCTEKNKSKFWLFRIPNSLLLLECEMNTINEIHFCRICPKLRKDFVVNF